MSILAIVVYLVAAAGAIGDDNRVTQALKNGAPVDGLDADGDTALVR